MSTATNVSSTRIASLSALPHRTAAPNADKRHFVEEIDLVGPDPGKTACMAAMFADFRVCESARVY